MTNAEAIKELNDLASFEISEYGEEHCEETLEALDMAREALQERKSARWVKSDSDKDFLTCSHCKKFPLRVRMAYKKELTKQFHFCPNCGYFMHRKRTT